MVNPNSGSVSDATQSHYIIIYKKYQENMFLKKKLDLLYTDRKLMPVEIV